MSPAVKLKELNQAVSDLWQKEVEKKETDQIVQKVMSDLREKRIANQLLTDDTQYESKRRERIKRTLIKIRRRKAEKQEKKDRAREAITKFSYFLGGLFLFNIVLAIVGAIVFYRWGKTVTW